MAKEILEGRKVQFRMAIENEFKYNPWDEFKTLDEFIANYSSLQKGDIVWVREPARVTIAPQQADIIYGKYLADNSDFKIRIPDRFIPYPKWVTNRQDVPNGCIKEMARIFLKIIDVRGESLQECIGLSLPNEGWDKTAPKGYKWEDNPFVFVYDFEVLSENPNAKN